MKPVKPIVYYLDTNFPTLWKQHIRDGVLSWNQAFEEIGFKDVIEIKDYPKEDSLFDPENLQYSCIRYVTNPVINAFGPSWTDPRTGEILSADIVFFHNLTKILHAWKFTQTAAVNPEVRKKHLSDQEMGEAIRYVAAHEAGHNLGLPHNMAASHAFPVDSLRSATFTQKYGTTPSIMDYARFNYVAQPGDTGVRLSPPDLGVYDKYSIAWGYQPIYTAKTPEEEYDTLNSWIMAHHTDPMYRFGQQQSPFFMRDPSSQTEDLGNDVLKASKYGIANINYILDSLRSWRLEPDRGYEEIQTSYNELFAQYNRFIGHIINYLGGVYQSMPIQSEDKNAFTLVNKAYQQEIIQFLFSEMKNQKTMWERKDLLEKFPIRGSLISDYQSLLLSRILGKSTLNKLITAEGFDANTYTVSNLFTDVSNAIWKSTLKKKTLSEDEMNLQYHFIKFLLKEGNYVSSGGFRFIFLQGATEQWSCSGLHDHAKEEHIISSGSREGYSTPRIKAIIYGHIKKSQQILRNAKFSGNEETRYHYQYLLNEIENKLKKQ